MVNFILSITTILGHIGGFTWFYMLYHFDSLFTTHWPNVQHPSTPRESARGPSLQRQALISLDIFADVGVVQPPDLLEEDPGDDGHQLHNVGKAIHHPQNNHKWVRIL